MIAHAHSHSHHPQVHQRISLPLEFVRKHGLKEGDHAMWIEEKGGVKLKFAKLAVFEKMAAGQQAAEEVALQQEARGD